MMKITNLLLILAIVLFSQSCATPEKKLQDSSAKLLTQSELMELFSIDRTATFVLQKGYTATAYYSKNGDQKIKHSNGMDEGTYRIENGTFCSKWKKMRNGEEKCGRFYKIDENEYTSVSLDGRRSIKLIFN